MQLHLLIPGGASADFSWRHQITALHCRWQASEVQGSEVECPACSYRIAEGGYWLARPVNFYALVSFLAGIWQGAAPLPAGIWQGGAPLPGDCIEAPSCWGGTPVRLPSLSLKNFSHFQTFPILKAIPLLKAM